ncbi:MAG: HIT family protein [Muribaculaceae bacterium]|nr:HIT family protein [Muribaculaceae bacterium]
MATIFSRIAAGEIPCYKIAEDDKHFAFLDINPVAPGHVLVIPRKEVDYIFDLSAEDTAALHVFARKVARAVAAAMPCKRVGMTVMGLEVPHTHIHLIPINKESDMNFFKEKLTLPEADMIHIADAIRAEFDKIND